MVYSLLLGICESLEVLDTCAFGREGTQLPEDSQEVYNPKELKDHHVRSDCLAHEYESVMFWGGKWPVG